ncbi:Scr1 family TA system antitoxin-like transcriptional regulator [Micromonospora sp. NPDC047134]|uniref:Scr1 family TA system antitoxin-like transcriptional regulator n=1 Tax=Micromonospora sp. NPDC047134 TaxID=3154340 RepID=UPI0033F7CAAC
MAEQLHHLVKVSRLPNVTIQVLRFEAGAHLADSTRLSAAYDNLRMLARSPAESIKFVKELSAHGA